MKNLNINYSKLTKAELIELLTEKDAWADINLFLGTIQIKGVLSETSTSKNVPNCSECPLVRLTDKIQKTNETTYKYQNIIATDQSSVIESLSSENTELKEEIRKLRAAKGMSTSTDHLTVEDMERIAFDSNTPEKEAKKVLRQLLKLAKNK